MRRTVIAFFASMATVSSWAACYSLYDSANRLVYQSTTSPIDLNRSISDEVARRFPGHHFVMELDVACADRGSLPGHAQNLSYDGRDRKPGDAPLLRSAPALRNLDAEAESFERLLNEAPPTAGPAPLSNAWGYTRPSGGGSRPQVRCLPDAADETRLDGRRVKRKTSRC